MKAVRISLVDTAQLDVAEDLQCDEHVLVGYRRPTDRGSVVADRAAGTLAQRYRHLRRLVHRG